MSEFFKPTALDQELIFGSNKMLISKSNGEGILEFANDDFMEISGYKESEIMGRSMFSVQHPDMPEVIFKMLWERLLDKEEFHVIMKNLAKSGKYYWTLTLYSVGTDEEGEIKSIYSKRILANKESVNFFSKYYETLTRIENKKNIEGYKDIKASENYLRGYLEENQTNFQSLVMDFYDKNIIIDFFEERIKPPIKKPISAKQDLKPEKSTKKKNLFTRLFGKSDKELEEERKKK